MLASPFVPNTHLCLAQLTDCPDNAGLWALLGGRCCSHILYNDSPGPPAGDPLGQRTVLYTGVTPLVSMLWAALQRFNHWCTARKDDTVFLFFSVLY